MSDDKINDQIIQYIRKESGDDNLMIEFLMKLIFYESENPYAFKDQYGELINEYSSKWGDSNEN